MGYSRVPRFEIAYDANDWFRKLLELGVSGSAAAQWAAPFAEEVQPGRFSVGLTDLNCWLAQVLHETRMLRALVEDLDYSAKRITEVWPHHFPDEAAALAYAHNPAKLAEKVYGGRMGNEMPGDGARYIGRGLIMITGRASYRKLGERMGQDLEGIPQLLEQRRYAIEGAIYWWEGDIPDLCLSDQAQIRRRVNGGEIGLEHCQRLHELVCKVMV